MRILVTGAAGFLGSHLSRELLAQGNEVVGVDNFYTGTRVNVLDLLKNPSFELIRHDITQPFFVEVDAVMNLACPASPIHYQKHPVQTTKTSVLGTTNMLGLAKRLDIPFLQASTSEVYGDPNVSPQLESYWGNVNPIGIRACYDEGKRVAETLCFDYNRQYGVKTKVVRIFNTYGPAMQFDDGRVVSNFLLQALTGKDITIYGDGSQTRSFCYVSDLVEGLVAMLHTDSTVTGPINLGNPTEITILQLAQLIIKITKSKSLITTKPLPSDDPQQRKPDITKAISVLSWIPKIKLEDGIQLTINDFQKRLESTLAN
jgi:UDP-glucuronate decarboxylase